MTTLGHSPNFSGVLSETKRIIRANSSNYLALSIILLLPFSLALVLYPFIFSYTAPDHTIPSPQKSYLVIALYVFFLILLSIFATGSITYSAFHGFYGRPVTYISSIKSISSSFFTLLATYIVYQIVLFLIFYFIWFLGVAIYQYYEGADSNYSLAFIICVTILIVAATFFLQVECSVAYAVVVVESKWGFESFKKSSQLIKGMRWVAMSLILYYGITIVLMETTAYLGLTYSSWPFIFQIVVVSVLMTVLMLNSITSWTVLYIFCKVLNGELAFEITEESAGDYAGLPSDDGQVPHVVYVVPPLTQS